MNQCLCNHCLWNMKKLILLFLLLACLNLAAHQKADSLLNRLPQVTGDEKARVLNQLSEYFQEDDSVQSLGYARQALSLAQESDNRVEMGDAYFYLAECLFCFEQYIPALKNYHKALDIIKNLNDRVRMGRIYNSIALAYYFRGEYDLAIENQIEAIRCLQNTGARHTLAQVYSNMGMVYSRLGDYRSSVNYYKMAAAINKEEGHVYSFAINHNGIGVAYYNMGKLDSSKVNYQIALKGFQSINDREKEAIALNNIANVLVDQGDSLEKALEYYQQALAVFGQLDDIHNTTFALESLGAAYLTMGDERKALETLRSGLALVKKNRGGYYIQQSYYKDISKTYEKMGKVNEAYAAYKLYRTYLDSLHQEERIRQVAELEKKFEMEKKEAEILKLNAEKKVGLLQIQKEKTIRISVMVLLLLTIVIMIYISYGYYEKKRTNLVLNQKNEQIEHQRNELEKINATKNRFFSILAHDLKNPFHTILGYSSLLDRDYHRFTEEERKKYAGDIHRSANNIFRLLQNLLDWSRSQTGNLKFNPAKFELKQLSETVFSLLKPLADQKDVPLNNHIPPGVYLYADPMMVETILRNLVSNAINFSYPGGHVTIRIIQDEPGQVTICINDKGQGLSRDDLQQLFRIDSEVRRKGTKGEKGSGLGLVLCKEFVQINKGTIRVESEPGKGSSFCVTIPAAPSEA